MTGWQSTRAPLKPERRGPSSGLAGGRGLAWRRSKAFAAHSRCMHVTLWVVKGGRGGIREERFRARSVIGIGWGEVGDLSQYPDRDALRAAYRGAHPERSEGHVNTQAAQLWAFGHRMQIGDPVVVPFLGQPGDRDR